MAKILADAADPGRGGPGWACAAQAAGRGHDQPKPRWSHDHPHRPSPADDATLHVLASMLPMRRFRDIPRFLRWTGKIRAQLRTADGCAGYSLDARPLRKTAHLGGDVARSARAAFVDGMQYALLGGAAALIAAALAVLALHRRR